MSDLVQALPIKGVLPETRIAMGDVPETPEMAFLEAMADDPKVTPPKEVQVNLVEVSAEDPDTMVEGEDADGEPNLVVGSPRQDRAMAENPRAFDPRTATERPAGPQSMQARVPNGPIPGHDRARMIPPGQDAAPKNQRSEEAQAERHPRSAAQVDKRIEPSVLPLTMSRTPDTQRAVPVLARLTPQKPLLPARNLGQSAVGLPAPSMAPPVEVPKSERKGVLPIPAAYRARSDMPSLATAKVATPAQALTLLPDAQALNADEHEMLPRLSFGTVGANDVAPSPRLAVMASAPVQADMARQVGAQLAVAVHHQKQGVTEVALNPPELGRVRLTLSAQDNVIALTVIAERAETQDLMRRHIEQLAQEFRDIGYDDIAFSFGDRAASDAEAEHDIADTTQDLSDTADEPAPSTLRPRVSDAALDLRL